MKEHTQENQMIDVVEDFVCPCQTEGYQNAMRKWRRNEKNRYAFRFTKHPKETSFSESMAVVEETAPNVEKGVLGRLGYLIGCVLVLYIVIENVLDKILVFIMNAMGMDVEMLFWGSGVYGDEKNVFLVIMLINTLKYLLPALVLMLVLRLPLKVSLPMRIAKPTELLFGISLTMLLSAGLGMFFVSDSSELEKYKLICNAVGVEGHRMVLYMLFTIFALPILIEFLLHGTMFQVLRQFGDTFAVTTVTVLAAILMHNLQDGLRVAVMTLTFSYFVIRTGSFLTAVLLHIVHEIYMFALFYIETFGHVYSPQWWMTILLPCAVGFAAGIYMLLHRSDSDETERRRVGFLSVPDKLAAFFSGLPILGLVVICTALTVISAVVKF